MLVCQMNETAINETAIYAATGFIYIPLLLIRVFKCLNFIITDIFVKARGRQGQINVKAEMREQRRV